MISLSAHFFRRQQQRGLRRDVLNFILEFGEQRFAKKTGWLIIELKALPPQLRNSSLARRAAQWVVMIEGERLITCYRNDAPIRTLRIAS